MTHVSHAVTLNAYQSELLNKFFDDEEIAADFGHDRQDYQLRWSTRPAPGSVEIVTPDGIVAEVLPPSDGPFQRDYRFQPPEAVRQHHLPLALGVSQRPREFYRDWQWAHGVYMDAPDEMPAGALESFDIGGGAFGASQMTWHREG